MSKLMFRAIPVVVLAAAMTGCSGGPPTDSAGLKSRNADVRRERVLELGQRSSAGTEGKKGLNDALTAMGQSDSDPLVRSAALASLERQDQAAAEDLAVQLAIDPDPMVRCDAMKVLSHGKSPRARSTLLYAVRNDKESDVRRQAVRGLGNFDDDEVVKLLMELLGDEDRGVVVASYRSLQRISGQNFGTRPALWQEWFESRQSVPAPPSEAQTEPAKEGPVVTPTAPAVVEKGVPATPPAVTEKPPPVDTAPAPTPTPVKEAPPAVAAPPSPDVVKEAPPTVPPKEKPAPDVEELKRFRR